MGNWEKVNTAVYHLLKNQGGVYMIRGD